MKEYLPFALFALAGALIFLVVSPLSITGLVTTPLVEWEEVSNGTDFTIQSAFIDCDPIVTDDIELIAYRGKTAVAEMNFSLELPENASVTDAVIELDWYHVMNVPNNTEQNKTESTPEPIEELAPTPTPTVEPTPDPTFTQTPEPTVEPTIIPTLTPEPTVTTPPEPVGNKTIILEDNVSLLAGSYSPKATVYVEQNNVFVPLPNCIDIVVPEEQETLECEITGFQNSELNIRVEITSVGNATTSIKPKAKARYKHKRPKPTPEPTEEPTLTPTPKPTEEPTLTPTPKPTEEPSPTITPTPEPTVEPTVEPTLTPSVTPTVEPTVIPTLTPEPTVEPIPTPTIEPNETVPVEPVFTILPGGFNKTEKLSRLKVVGKSKEITTHFEIIKKNGTEKIRVRPEKHVIKEIEFSGFDLQFAPEEILRIDEINNEKILEKDFTKVYAIDPTAINFTEATVTVTATGNKLYKCKEWEFDSQSCLGSWELFKTGLVPGQDYTFILTPDDPGFGEIEVSYAAHLDSSKQFISDIFDEVKFKDNVWSEKIYHNEYIRATFDTEMTNGNVINLFVRNQGKNDMYVEIYEKDGTVLLGSDTISSERMYDIKLFGMTGFNDEFDIKIVGFRSREFLEFDYVHDSSGSVTCYFDAYGDTDSWDDSDPSELVDGSTSTNSADNNDGHYVHLDSNTCNDTDLGDIDSVEFRVYFENNYDANPSRTIVPRLVPYFDGTTAGDNHNSTVGNYDGTASFPDWSEWFDVTTDTNAPGTWGWDDVDNLDCRVISYRPNSGRLYVYKVEMRVNYSNLVELTLVSPLNGTYSDTWVWANLTTDITAAWCGYSLDGAANQSMSGSGTSWYSNVSSLSESTHNIDFYCNDTAGDFGLPVTEYFSVNTSSGDAVPPTVTIDSPSNQTYGKPWVWMNTSLNEDGSWCGYSLDGAANQSMSGSGTSWFYNATSISHGSHNSIIYCNDTSGNMGSSTQYFSIDTNPPEITLVSPLNQSYSGSPVLIEITLNETGSWAGYSLDGAANQSMDGEDSSWSYDATVSVGSHNVIIYANDSLGNMAKSITRWFTSNAVPTHSNPVLNSSWNMNQTNENLTCFNQTTADNENDAVKNIFDWAIEGTSIFLTHSPFEGGSTNTFTKDYSGALGYDLTAFATWNSNAGYDGKGAYEFNGVNQYIDLDDGEASSVYDGSFTERSFVMWFKADAVTGTDYRTLFKEGGGTNGANIYIYNSKIYAGAWSEGDSWDGDWRSFPVTAGEWHFVAFVFNGTGNKTSLFYDGSWNSTTSSAGYRVAGHTGDDGLGWHDGVGEAPGAATVPSGSYFTGTIDEFMVFNRALSQDQLNAFYQNMTNTIVSTDTSVKDAWSCKITPNDGLEDGSTLVSNEVIVDEVLNVAPIINAVYNKAAEDPISCTTTAISAVQFNVTDDDGRTDINLTTTYVNFTNGVTTYQATSCVDAGGSGNDMTINCTGATFNYYDAVGNWSITAFVADNSSFFDTDVTKNMTYNEGIHVRINNGNVSFGTIYKGSTNNLNTNSPEISFENCGNVALNTSITGANITDGSSNAIPITQFKIDDDKNAGDDTGNEAILALSEAAQVFSNSTGIGLQGNWTTFFFLDVPITQELATYNQGVWSILATKT